MTQQHTNSGGALKHDDLTYWQNRLNVVLAKPSEQLNSRSGEGAQSWFNSFWSCFSPVDTCLITCCVPCFTFGKTHHRIQHQGNLEGYESVNTSCLLFCASSCFGLHWVPTAMQRQLMREKYNLEGSCVKDLVASFCCPCCTLMQADKEATHREGLLPQHAPQTQQYETNNTGMVYAQGGQPHGGEISPAPAAAPAPAQAPITEK